MNVIVSRHKAAIEWLQERVPELKAAPVLVHVTADDVKGKVVYGNLPLELAALARAVFSVQFLDLPSDKRGYNLTLEEMDLYGAFLAGYRVDKIL